MKKSLSEEEQKLMDIRQRLDRGESRHEIANALGYKNYRCLHTYMTRKGFRWDPKKQSYIPPSRKKKPVNSHPESHGDGKSARIIALFDEGMDAKEVAEEIGFSRYLDMASYMSSRGYKWEPEEENYVQLLKQPMQKKSGVSRVAVSASAEGRTSLDTPKITIMELLQNCFSNMDWLMSRRESLEELLETAEESREVCRYELPGGKVSKKLTVPSSLVDLLLNFSQEKTVKAEDVIQTAVLEYLKTHGYRDEVDSLLH